jgi:hypothetical protein
MRKREGTKNFIKDSPGKPTFIGDSPGKPKVIGNSPESKFISICRAEESGQSKKSKVIRVLPRNPLPNTVFFFIQFLEGNAGLFVLGRGSTVPSHVAHFAAVEASELASEGNV